MNTLKAPRLTAMPRCLIMAAAAAMLFFNSAWPVDDYSTWSNWRYIYLITNSSGAKVTTGAAYNIPVLIRLNPANFDGLGSASDAGADIRFSKADGTHLYYERERWTHTSTTNDTAEFWVLVDTVKSNDTTKLKMYWNWGSAVDSTRPTSVFATTNGFVGVYHMDQASGSATDVTSNGLNGTATGGGTYSQEGNIRYSGGFDGNGDYFNMGNNSKFQMDAADKVTISAWVNRAGAAVSGDEDGIAGKFEWSSGNYREYCLINKNTTNHFQFHVSQDGTNETALAATTTTTNGIWYYVTGMMNASNMYIYVNGAQENSVAKTAIYGSTNATFRIGVMDDNGSSIRQYFNGKIDEVRVENTNRSVEWIKLCYQNQRVTNGRDSLVWFSPSYCQPARYTWDDNTSAGYTGGSHTWSTSDAYWSQTGTSLVSWPGPGNTAVFDGSDGNYAVTVSNTQYVDSISFTNGGYRVTGGTALYVAKKLSGAVFGFSPPYAAGSDSAKAFDGSTSTFCDDAAASSGVTGIDLGSGNAQQVAYIRYYPRATLESRMNSGKFQGSNDGSSYTDLYTIPSNPSLAWQTVAVSNTTAWRYLRYLSPSGSYCNIGECEFYGMGSIYVASGKYDTIATVLAGNSGIRKYGAGYITLSGSNTYPGPTQIYGGRIQVSSLANGGSNSGIGSSTNAAANLVLDGGGLRYIGSGESCDRLFTLGTTASVLYNSGSGALTLSNTGSIAFTGSGTRSLEIGGGYTGTNVFASILADGTGGATALTKTGTTSTWALTGTNTYTGVTTISEGTLSIGNGGATGAISNSSNAAVASGATLAFNRSDYTYNGVISGAGAVTQSGSGTTTLGGTNTYTGVTTISAGAISAATLANGGSNSNIGAAAASAANIVLNGGGLTYTGGAQSCNRLFTLGTSGGTITASGSGALNLTGTTAWTISGTGTRTLTLGGTSTGDNILATIIGNDGSSNATSLTKSGAGKWILTGTNTYTGTTTISAGTLQIGNNGTAGVVSNSSNISNSGTLIFYRSNAYTYNGAISGSGALTNSGAGTITLGGSSSYSGVTTISAGAISTATLANGLSNSNIGAADVTASNLVINGGTLIYTGSGSTSNRLFTIGTGTSGATIDASGSGALTLNGSGSIATTGTGTRTLTLTGSSTAANTLTPVVANQSSNATSLTKSGAGTWVLSGANTYTGPTTISAGKLQLGASGVIADADSVYLANVASAIFDLNGNSETIGQLAGGGAIGGNITLGAGTLTCGTTNSSTYSGVISGTGGLTKAGSGTLTLSGTNTYSGVTTLNAGTVSITTLANGLSNSNIGAAANTADKLVFNGGTLSYGGGAQDCDRLFTLGNSGGTITSSGSGALNLNNTGSIAFSGTSARTLTLNGTQTGNNTLAAVIGDNTGATAITKSGAGKWILSAANTCSGAVTVSDGTLLVTNTSGSGTGTGAVSVASGGTLGGTGRIGGAVSVSSGGTLSPGNDTKDTLIINNNLALASGAFLAIEIDGTEAGIDYDQVAVNGTVNLAGATLSITLGYPPTAGEQYTIIDNDDVDAITSTFTGIAEGGTTTTIFGGTTYGFTVSYIGGTGNDVVLTAAGIYGENYADWLYSQKIFINTSPSGAALSSNASTIYNFPLLVRLDSTRFYRFYQTAANGADIRFANRHGEHLSYDMEYWKDNTGDNDTAAIWVLVDTIRPSCWSNYITMYWGNTSAASKSDSAAVFATTNNFQGVWHLKEHGTNTSYYDATSNGYTGTGVSTTTSSDVTAMVGKGIDLDGSADYITCTGFPNSNLSQLSISTWVRLDAQADWKDIISKETGDYATAGFGLRRTSDDKFVFTFRNNSKRELTATNAFTDNGATWYLVTGTYDGSAQRLYVNGAEAATAVTGLSGSITGSTNSLDIGCRTSGPHDRFIDGVLDEVVISDVARSADWIKLCYETQKATCDTIVDIENYADWTYSQNITVNTTSTGANVSGDVTKFPMLVRLDPTNFGGFANTLTGGADIRFAKSNGIHLPYEIERWTDVSGNIDTAVIWVLLDTVFGNSSSQYFTMYWGRSGKTSRSAPRTVFDTANGYKGVWHLGEEGDANAVDATAAGVTGTKSGFSTSSDVGGAIGIARNFNGSTDYITLNTSVIKNVLSSGNQKATISFWMNADATNYTRMIVWEGVATQNGFGSGAEMHVCTGANPSGTTSDDYLTYYFGDGSNYPETGNIVHATTAFTDVTNWRYVSVTVDVSSSATLYLDGASVNTDGGAASMSMASYANTIFGKPGTSERYYDGILDEVSIADSTRSADWIKLCYETQKPNSQAAVTENYGEWPYSQKIYLNTTSFSGSNVTTAQYNFPALVRLDTVNFRYFSQTLANGADIRFAKNDGTHLNYEIERWQDNAANNDTAVIWVKVDTIQPINGLQYVNMYWGKAGASSMSNGPQVFGTSNGFVGVYHMNQASGTITDATANGLNGTAYGNVTYAQTGNIATANGFDGNGDSVRMGNNALFQMDAADKVTVSAWVNRTGANGSSNDEGIAGKFEWTSGDYREYLIGNHTTNGFYFVVSNDGTSTNETKLSSSIVPSNGSWYYLTGMMDASNMYVFVNGAQKNSTAKTAIYGSTNATAKIGVMDDNGSIKQYFNGTIDEVRIENTNRSDQWIKLCYENQKSSQTFCDYEDYSTWRYSRRVTINTADMGLSGNVVKFPLLVRLNADNFDFSQANGTAQDIRFAKANGVHLLYEKERWDSTNALAELWVLVDTVKNANSTQYINMYWGKTGVFSKSNPTRVFDTANGFKNVFHLNETSGSATDITLNAKTAAYQGNLPRSYASIVGLGQDLDGTGDYADLSTYTTLDGLGALTVSFWVSPDALNWGSTTGLFCRGSTGQRTPWVYGTSGSNTVTMQMETASGATDLNLISPALTAATWNHVAFSWTGTRCTTYVNGTAGSYDATTGTAISNTDGTNYIGFATGNASLDGKLDQLEISRAARSADWIKLCYETQKLNPSATITDMEAFRPCSLKTTADQCSVWTTGWTLVFDKYQHGSAGKYGGITILTDSAHGKTTSNPATPSNNVGASQNLFYVTYGPAGSTVTSMQPTSGGTWSVLDTVGRIYARMRQTCTLVDLPFTIDYTIHGSGKMFVRVSVTNRTGGDISGKTLQFNLRRRVPTSGNVTVSVGNSTAGLCPYVLVSCDSARHIDPMLALSALWNSDSGAMNSASGLVNTAGSGLAGWENTSWAIADGQRQVWTFMLDFSHKAWNDSAGVGAYVNSFRRPDSLEFLAGFPVLEQSWEEYIYGHWKLDETTGDSAYDFSGFGYHGKKTASGTWATGKIGNGLSFTGSQKITVANTQKLDGRSPDGFTVLMWIKPSTAIDANTTLFGKYSGDNLGYKFLGTAGGQLSVKADDQTINGVTAVGTGTWKHVAVSVNTNPNWPRRTKIYINGRLDKLDSTTVTTVSENSEDITIGYGLAGMIDDVRYFYRELSEETIEAIYKLGFRVANGTYQVRADNNNTVHLRIDGGTYKRRFPVFQIDNYWGAAKPAAGCVVYNGSALTENTHYFCKYDGVFHKLYIALNKIVTADSTLLYIDDKNGEGSRAVTPTKRMVWGKYSGARNWFWCKNFSGDYFGAAGTNQFYAAWKMDSTISSSSTSRGGEVCRFKSSNLAPYYKPDTSTDSSLMSTNSQTGGTPLGQANFDYASGYNLTSSYDSIIPTYTVVESSMVRIQLKLNERIIRNGSEQVKLTTRWTVYPTGQIFRWDSVSSFANPPQKTYYGCTFHRYLASPTVALNKVKMRGVMSAANTIHDHVVAFLSFKSAAGTITPTTNPSTPWKTDTIADGTAASYKTGLLFRKDTTGVKTYWSSTPVQTAFYFDYQRDNIDASTDDLYRDSVSNGVQVIGVAGGAALGMTTGTLLSGANATSGDLNADGFNEREGAYVIRASNNAAVFTLPASRDTCRFYPVFRITNYMANQKPQYIFCYPTDPANHAIDTLALIEGYEYNIYHKKSSNELVIQVDSVFCDSAVFYIAADRTLAVEMSRFGASGGDACDTVRWRTESESENLGYYIYRRIKPSFIDSLAKATDTVAQDTLLDDVAVLFKKKAIAFVDTGWARITEKLIPSASGGTAFGPTDYMHIDYRNVYNDVVYEYRIESIDYQNNSDSYGPAEARPKGWVPVKFALWGNFPNPFRKMTAIRFDLPIQSKVDIRIYNLQGKLVRKLVRPEKLLKVGRHKVMWDGLTETGQPAAAGPYVYHMMAGKRFAKAKIMVMVR